MQREAKGEELENRRRRDKRKTGRRGFKMSFRAVRVTFVDREYDNSSSVLNLFSCQRATLGAPILWYKLLYDKCPLIN